MRRHYLEIHAGLEVSFHACFVQNLAPPPIIRYFGVQAEVPRPASREEGDQVRSSLAEALASAQELPVVLGASLPSQIPPILRSLGWSGEEPFGDLRERLSTFPKLETDPGWDKFQMLTGYFLGAFEKIARTGYRVRSLLKEDGPAFQKLLKLASEKRYAHTMARFVWYSIRAATIPDAPVTISTSLRIRIHSLEAELMLEESPDDSWEDSVLCFLEGVLMTRPATISSDELIPQFIRLNCQVASWTIVSIDKITQLCSMVCSNHLRYFIKCFVLL